MNVLRLFIMLLCIPAMSGYAIVPYRTEIKNKGIKTLQVDVANKKPGYPVIELQGSDVIEINFDALNHASGWFAYSITHCNADWTPSALTPMEFMDGFQNLSIDDFANSLNTRTGYTNYHLFLPNEDIQFKVSGNYVIEIYNENTPNEIALSACFSIVETHVNITGSVTTDADTRHTDSRQLVNFVVNHPNHKISFPQMDIKAFVYQNNTLENAVKNVSPSRVAPGQIIYEDDSTLLFNAGNEYRRMDFLNKKTPGMHVLSIGEHKPYTVELMADYPRGAQNYMYDQDRNGRFVIRNSEVEDPDTEADYQLVHFTLKSDSLFGGNIHLYGKAFQNVLNNESRMTYNREKKTYEKSVLLKQGSYNYQYAFLPEGEATATRNMLEGNFYQTENEYTILIFYRPMGIRYDRLIGIKTISSAQVKL